MRRIAYNPYGNGSGMWLRGNLHAHTTNSDGFRTPQELVDAYAALGYDFLMISDHDVLTDVEGLADRGLVLLSGCEVTARGPHILHADARRPVQPLEDRQQVLDRIGDAEGFAIMNHPNWERSFAHCPQADLERWQGYGGIEIYNGVVRRQEGNPQATDRWDRLLGLGRRVWGFANDDAHEPEDEGVAWNVALAEGRTPEAVMQALRQGRFYAGTGVAIVSVEVDGTVIRVATDCAQRIVVHSDFGHREAAVDGPVLAYDAAECGGRYVRFECWGPGDRMAWTQPIFLE